MLVLTTRASIRDFRARITFSDQIKHVIGCDRSRQGGGDLDLFEWWICEAKIRGFAVRHACRDRFRCLPQTAIEETGERIDSKCSAERLLGFHFANTTTHASNSIHQQQTATPSAVRSSMLQVSMFRVLGYLRMTTSGSVNRLGSRINLPSWRSRRSRSLRRRSAVAASGSRIERLHQHHDRKSQNRPRSHLCQWQ